MPVLGYCMGGTLAVGLAARRPADVAALVTIGAPWDFASTRGVAGGIRAMLRADGAARAESLLDGLGEAFGQVPVSVFQTLFAMVNPIQASLKFQKLARLDPDGAGGPAVRRARGLAGRGRADAGRRGARPAGRLADPQPDRHRRLALPRRRRSIRGAIAAPALVVSGAARLDRAAAARASRSAGLIPGARTLAPQTGHVGMVVGSLARPQVWRPIAGFLARPPGGADVHPVEPPRPLCEQGWPDAPAAIRPRIRRDDRSRIRGPPRRWGK